MKTCLIVFAGPNGSGKSTLTRKFMQQEDFVGGYINADEIARIELGHIQDEYQRNIEAAFLANQRRRNALESGQSFAFETVMSTPGKLAILQEARANGFRVELVFVTTLSASINIRRVARRAELGGHNVDPIKIQERYERAMNLLPSAVDLSDKAYIYDNSVRMMLVAMKHENTLTLFNIDKAPNWVQERIVVPFHERAASRSQMEDACRHHADNNFYHLREANICHGQTHRGIIVDVNEYHVLLCVDANDYLLHDRALCPPINFQIGQDVAIPYFYEDGGKHREVVDVLSALEQIPTPSQIEEQEPDSRLPYSSPGIGF